MIVTRSSPGMTPGCFRVILFLYLQRSNVATYKIIFTMAIIRSVGIGRSRGSAGEITYRVVRGRTIGSQKVGSRASTRGIGNGTIQNAIFGIISMYMDVHSTDIDLSFNKTKYGSSRNYFMKINWSALRAAVYSLANTAMSNGYLPPIDEVEAAIVAYATANPTKILRVKLTGFDVVYLTGEWSSEDNPISGGAVDGLGTGTAHTVSGSTVYDAPVALSLSYHAGAVITRPAGTASVTSNVFVAAPASIVFVGNGGNPLSPQPSVSNITFSEHTVTYTSGAVTGATAVMFDNVYIRLTSAYTSSSDDDTDPV